jgi:hypothetical protein
MLDYKILATKYKPEKVTTLLIAETPPPNGERYFYLPRMLRNGGKIENDQSLPATIFHHYFGKRPSTEAEYEGLLFRLKEKDIFLIDLIDEPRRIRDRNGIRQRNQENLAYLINQIPLLRKKIENLEIKIDDENIIFLLARNDYKRQLKEEFPCSQFYKWKEFRMIVDILVSQ